MNRLGVCVLDWCNPNEKLLENYKAIYRLLIQSTTQIQNHANPIQSNRFIPFALCRNFKRNFKMCKYAKSSSIISYFFQRCFRKIFVAFSRILPFVCVLYKYERITLKLSALLHQQKNQKNHLCAVWLILWSHANVIKMFSKIENVILCEWHKLFSSSSFNKALC